MNRPVVITLVLTSLFLAGCASNPQAASAGPVGPKQVPVTTALAVTRTVPAAFQETGTFVADETSDIAPMVPGRVIATPANVGDFVKQGQVVCELDHRDAQLRLDQARAALDQATAGVRQSQSRIGFSGQGKFDPALMPEAVAARATLESAQALARQAAADAKRYENLVASGDVSRSAFERARTQQETAEAQTNAARQQYEATLNGARQSWGAVENSQASLEGIRAQRRKFHFVGLPIALGKPERKLGGIHAERRSGAVLQRRDRPRTRVAAHIEHARAGCEVVRKTAAIRGLIVEPARLLALAQRSCKLQT